MIDSTDGDYDMMTGVIKNFSFTARQDGGFDCETIITSISIDLMSKLQGTPSSLDPIITFDLQDKNKDKKEFKIQQIRKTTYQEGDNNRLVRLNSTISLKIFLDNIDYYVFQQMKNSYPNNKINNREKKSLNGDEYEVRYTK